MADAFFTAGLDLLAQWETDTYKALLLDTSYTFDPDHVFVDDLDPGTNELAVAGYTRADITTPVRDVESTPARVQYQCDSLDFGTPAIGGTYRWLILYKFVTDDADSPVIGAYDLDSGGIATTGDPLVVPTLSTGLAYIDDQT